MTQYWKPTADEKRAIRAVAAASEGKKPMAIHIEVGERISLREEDAGKPMAERVSLNILMFGEDRGLDSSDLNQPLPLSEIDSGVELIAGRAIVDFYVYEKLIGDHGDLLTNVQAHVETIDGKPTLVKITGTAMPPVEGDALWGFMMPPKSHQTTMAGEYIGRWKRAYRALNAR